MSIDEALKYLKGKTKSAFTPDEELRGITTGSLVADLVTGIGGFPVGRLSEVFGWESSGKTTLCLQACARAQAQGRYCAYLDAERGVDLSYATRLGFIHDDEAKGLYLKPDTFEDTMIIVEKLSQTGEVPLIIVDSVSALIPEEEFKGKIEDTGPLAKRGRMMSAFLPRITKTIAGNTALVFVNQMRQKIDTFFVPSFMKKREDTEQSSGGSALKFYSSLRLNMQLSKRGFVKKKTDSFFDGASIDIPLANLHHVHGIKNKVGTPYRKGPIYIRYDAEKNLWGIDNVKSVIDIAVAMNIITSKANGVYVIGATTVRSEDALFQHLIDHPDQFEALQEQVLQLPQVASVLAHQV